ncbi:hypothetical protein NMG60_11027250 [Bertholletia excelsa]
MSPTASSSPSSSSNPTISPSSLHLHHPHLFTPIQECDREETEDEFGGKDLGGTPCGWEDKREMESKHQPTPLHGGRGKSRRRPEFDTGAGDDDRGVSCNKCRPSNREKISVVPLDNRSSSASPNGIFKSILSSLTKKSPRASAGPVPATEEHWKAVVAELSHKLIQATRKRDEAVLEASRLKYSMAELEKKLNKLEIYCHSLKSGLDVCTKTSPYRSNNSHAKHNPRLSIGDHDKVIERFLVSVSEARSSIRLLSRSLTLQLRQMGVKIYDRISLLLQPYDIKVSPSKNPKAFTFYLESLLNRAFFEDFESIGFQKSAPNQILNPIERCESNFAAFNYLQGLTWEEVLNKGTRHFSEDFSKFCDRKMSEIVAMLGWNRAWPESLLQAFFVASKSVWLVHLLANSVQPGLSIFRVDKGVRFEPFYMEDMGGDRAQKLVPAVVRIMVTPGFYVYGNVVKCKVICRYHGNNGSNLDGSEKGSTFTPSPI